MPNAYSGRSRGLTIVPECIVCMGDSNAGTGYSEGLPSYFHSIANARNFSIIKNGQVDGIGVELSVPIFRNTLLNWRASAYYINLGTNDAGSPLTSDWGDWLRSMVDDCVETGALVTLGTPVEVQPGAVDPRPYMADYVAEIIDIADDYGTACVLFDANAITTAWTAPQKLARYTGDFVHLNGAGHTALAAAGVAQTSAFKIRV